MLLGQTWDLILAEWRGNLWLKFLIFGEMGTRAEREIGLMILGICPYPLK